jgi:DNA-binding CsgD family transcriptional regulator
MHTLTDTLPQAVLAQMADALMWPLLVLQADGTLVHANRAASRLLNAQRLITVGADRRLGLLPASRQPEWQAALAAAHQGQTVVLTWPAEAGGLGTAATLGPLNDPRAAVGGSAQLLLALSTTEPAEGPVLAFAQLYRLSPAETRVLQRLALGDSSGEAALALGVSDATVRSQIISLRRKTGHGSVMQLLRGLASMPPVNPGGPPGTPCQ